MKTRILIFLIALATLVGCGMGKAQKGPRSAPRAADRFAEEIEYIDSLRWITGGPEYALDTIDPDTLRSTWEGFAKLFTEEKYEEAYDYLKDKGRYGNVLIYLRNSTAQYVFVSTVWNYCVSAHAGSDEEYFKELEPDYALVLLLTRGVVEMGGDDPYIPPHYMDLVMEYSRLLLTMNEITTSETFDEEIYFAAKATYGDEMMASFLGLVFRSKYLCKVGREAKAHSELEAFRQRARNECQGEELEKLLAAIDATERDMTKTELD